MSDEADMNEKKFECHHCILSNNLVLTIYQGLLKQIKFQGLTVLVQTLRLSCIIP